MKHRLRWVLGIFGFAMIVSGIAFLLIYRWYVQADPAVSGEPVVIDIQPGAAFRQVAEQLHARGLMNHPKLWTLAARLDGGAKNIKAGEYEISATDSPRDILRLLQAGRVTEYYITIIEGWTYKRLLDVMKADDRLVHKLTTLAEETALLAQLELSSAEGWFLPDTYQFRKGASDAKILTLAHRAMQAELQRAWQHRQPDLPYETPYEMLTMASIVEKETGRAAERPLIAQVFVRRLDLGMRLQTDPTVIYGLGDDYNGNITKAHLRKLTPFNTYLNKGLPPTPIALPGRDAIGAAAAPGDTQFLYFVARGDGSSEFSRTLIEHEKAVRKYQLLR